MIFCHDHGYRFTKQKIQKNRVKWQWHVILVLRSRLNIELLQERKVQLTLSLQRMTRTQDYKMENKKLQDGKMTCATTENINIRQMMKKLTCEIKQESSNVVRILIKCLKFHMFVFAMQIAQLVVFLHLGMCYAYVNLDLLSIYPSNI
jgi:hypothetical protein